MKNLLLVVFIFCFCNCQKLETDDFCDTPKKVFNSLPEAKVCDNQGPYKLLVDTVNSNPQAYYHVSGKLFYQEKLLWQVDSTFAISATSNNDVVFVQNSTAIGTFGSYLFYKGQDITAKVIPQGFPAISEVRFDNNLIYLSFGDYGTFRRNEENLYASYNLLTGALRID